MDRLLQINWAQSSVLFNSIDCCGINEVWMFCNDDDFIHLCHQDSICNSTSSCSYAQILKINDSIDVLQYDDVILHDVDTSLQTGSVDIFFNTLIQDSSEYSWGSCQSDYMVSFVFDNGMKSLSTIKMSQFLCNSGSPLLYHLQLQTDSNDISFTASYPFQRILCSYELSYSHCYSIELRSPISSDFSPSLCLSAPPSTIPFVCFATSVLPPSIIRQPPEIKPLFGTLFNSSITNSSFFTPSQLMLNENNSEINLHCVLTTSPVSRSLQTSLIPLESLKLQSSIISGQLSGVSLELINYISMSLPVSPITNGFPIVSLYFNSLFLQLQYDIVDDTLDPVTFNTLQFLNFNLNQVRLGPTSVQAPLQWCSVSSASAKQNYFPCLQFSSILFDTDGNITEDITLVNEIHFQLLVTIHKNDSVGTLFHSLSLLNATLRDILQLPFDLRNACISKFPIISSSFIEYSSFFTDTPPTINVRTIADGGTQFTTDANSDLLSYPPSPTNVLVSTRMHSVRLLHTTVVSIVSMPSSISLIPLLIQISVDSLQGWMAYQAVSDVLGLLLLTRLCLDIYLPSFNDNIDLIKYEICFETANTEPWSVYSNGRGFSQNSRCFVRIDNWPSSLAIPPLAQLCVTLLSLDMASISEMQGRAIFFLTFDEWEGKKLPFTLIPALKDNTQVEIRSGLSIPSDSSLYSVISSFNLTATSPSRLDINFNYIGPSLHFTKIMDEQVRQRVKNSMIENACRGASPTKFMKQIPISEATLRTPFTQYSASNISFWENTTVSIGSIAVDSFAQNFIQGGFGIDLFRVEVTLGEKLMKTLALNGNGKFIIMQKTILGGGPPVIRDLNAQIPEGSYYLSKQELRADSWLGDSASALDPNMVVPTLLSEADLTSNSRKSRVISGQTRIYHACTSQELPTTLFKNTYLCLGFHNHCAAGRFSRSEGLRYTSSPRDVDRSVSRLLNCAPHSLDMSLFLWTDRTSPPHSGNVVDNPGKILAWSLLDKLMVPCNDEFETQYSSYISSSSKNQSEALSEADFLMQKVNGNPPMKFLLGQVNINTPTIKQVDARIPPLKQNQPPEWFSPSSKWCFHTATERDFRLDPRIPNAGVWANDAGDSVSESKDSGILNGSTEERLPPKGWLVADADGWIESDLWSIRQYGFDPVRQLFVQQTTRK